MLMPRSVPSWLVAALLPEPVLCRRLRRWKVSIGFTWARSCRSSLWADVERGSLRLSSTSGPVFWASSILQAGQGNIERIVADVKSSRFRNSESQRLRFRLRGRHQRSRRAGVHSDAQLRGLGDSFPLVPDPNFAFWGKLGVIASPTAVVVGSDGRIQWVRAGYGYDFIAGFHAQLRKALGLSDRQ